MGGYFAYSGFVLNYSSFQVTKLNAGLVTDCDHNLSSGECRGSVLIRTGNYLSSMFRTAASMVTEKEMNTFNLGL